MTAFNKFSILFLLCGILYGSCKIPAATELPQTRKIPGAFDNNIDSINSADIKWRDYFSDPYLISLIDSAIAHNPDLYITLQDINIAEARVKRRHGELLPKVDAGATLGVEKVGRYTSQGAGDASAEITPGKIVPENLTDLYLGFNSSWELDIWGKLKSAKKAAISSYLGTIEGKNFVLTSLIAEVANSYYELLALDSQSEIIRQMIRLQQNQLEIVKVQKEAAVVTELAVKQFEAQLLRTQSMEFALLQNKTLVENNINFLLGRYPQPIARNGNFMEVQLPARINAGIPIQLLENRPDIRRAELELQSVHWELNAARKSFYPSLRLSASVGFQAFKPSYLLSLPESLIYSLIGDLAGPVINRNDILAEYRTANARQVQVMYEYQKTMLNGYNEVANELSNMHNLQKQFDFKSREVDVLRQSIDISHELFNAARANYLEVLTTQREALFSSLELVEVKKQEFKAATNIYRALGGGWK